MSGLQRHYCRPELLLQQCILASRLGNTLKTKIAFSIQYKMRLFFYKLKFSLATSAMQLEHIHGNHSETSKLTPALKRFKKLVKSGKSEQGIGASKLSSTGTVLNCVILTWSSLRFNVDTSLGLEKVMSSPGEIAQMNSISCSRAADIRVISCSGN